MNPKPPKHGFRHNDYLSILLRSWDMAKTLMLVAAILKSKIALIPLCYYHHNWPPRPRKHGFRHQNYPSILPRSWDMAYSLILVAAILKSNMAADKRKSQPGKLPIMILEILRNILIPLASFYPECLADLIFRHKFGFCPLTSGQFLSIPASLQRYMIYSTAFLYCIISYRVVIFYLISYDIQHFPEVLYTWNH